MMTNEKEGGRLLGPEGLKRFHQRDHVLSILRVLHDDVFGVLVELELPCALRRLGVDGALDVHQAFLAPRPSLLFSLHELILTKPKSQNSKNVFWGFRL